MKIVKFCDRHHACADGRAWALEQGVETMAELWELPMRPDWRIWVATREGVLTPQQRVAFACRCVRRIWHLLEDERSRTAVETAERWARGEASDEELETAAYAAYAARSAAAAYAAYAAYAARVSAVSSAVSSAAACAASAASARSAVCFATERDWQARELVNTFGNPFRTGDEQ